MFGGRVFQQTVGIHMGTYCAHRLTESFLYSCEEDFIYKFFMKNEQKLYKQRYIILRLVIMLIVSLWLPQIQLCVFHALTYTS